MDQTEKVHNTRLFMTYPWASAWGSFLFTQKLHT